MIERYASLSAARFGELVRDPVTVIVPCAPLEVHGPHLPLATDIIQAEHYAQAFAERLSGSQLSDSQERHFVIHPTIPLGVDPLPMAGSIGHDMDVVRRVLFRIGESLHHSGVDSMVITNFHGSPRHVLAHELACDDLWSTHGFRAIAPMGLILGSIVESSLGEQLGVLHDHLEADMIDCETHAGALETSIIMAMGHEPDEEHRELPTLDFRVSGGRIANFFRAARAESQRRLNGQSESFGKFLWQLEAFFRVTDHFNRFSYGGAPPLATREMGEVAIEEFTAQQLRVLERFFEAPDPRAEEFQSVFWKNRHIILSGVIELLSDGGWKKGYRGETSPS